MLFTLTLALALGAEPQKITSETTPKPHPLAPSLPELSEAQEKKIDGIIDRFIEADTGQLKGPEAKQAMDDFKNLGPEAFFALVRGLNKAALINHSCPAVVIARKLNTQLRSSEDTELLQYARENIGAGVKGSKHGDVLRDLRVISSMRQNALKNQPRPTILGGPSK